MSVKKILFFLIIFFITLAPLIVQGADDKYGVYKTAHEAGLDTTGPEQLPVLIGKVLGTGLSLVGVLFFALMLYGGLTWMLARGNTEQETKALNTITAAIIGIVIVLASYAITNFVFTSIGTGGGGSPTAVSCKLAASVKDGVECKFESGDTAANCSEYSVCEMKANKCVVSITKVTVYCATLKQAECIGSCEWK